MRARASRKSKLDWTYYLHVPEVLEMRAAWRADPIVTPRDTLNDGNCRFTMAVVKGHGARDALPEISNITVFTFGKRNSTTIKHVYNESADVIAMEGTVSCARLRYIRDYLTHYDPWLFS